MQGSCKGPPPPAFLAKLSPTAELLPLQEGQCLILLQRSFAFQDGDVWFDNLLLRFQRVERNYHSYTGISTRQHNANSNLFMTRMAFQGDGQQAEDLGNTQAIGLNRKTSMYAEGARQLPSHVPVHLTNVSDEQFLASPQYWLNIVSVCGSWPCCKAYTPRLLMPTRSPMTIPPASISRCHLIPIPRNTPVMPA